MATREGCNSQGFTSPPHVHTVVNKETSVSVSVAEEVVDRDLEFFIPGVLSAEGSGIRCILALEGTYREHLSSPSL
jgi:hypothetical protein